MSTYDDRLTVLEQTVTSLRSDFLQAISDNTRAYSAFNRVVVQQEQSVRDANHEITILVGVVGSQGQDIKSIKDNLNVVKTDLHVVKDELRSVKTGVEEQGKKLDQILLLLSTLKSGPQQET